MTLSRHTLSESTIFSQQGLQTFAGVFYAFFVNKSLQNGFSIINY